MIEDDEPGWLRRNFAGLVAAVVAGLAIAGAAYVVTHLGGAKPTLKQVQQVTLLKPPPPPPPPPQDQPKPVEPEKIAEPDPIQPMDEVKELPPMPDLPPAPGPLGLDAEGTGAGDAYGLVGQPGGRALGEGGYGSSGGGGASGPATWRWYANAVQAEFIDALRNNEATRYANFSRAQLAIWADPEGRITKVRLYRSTGDAEVDAAIERDLPRLVMLRQPPPKDMPLPIKFYLSPKAQRQG